MNSYGEIVDPQEVIARDAARQQEVTERLKYRADMKKLEKSRLEDSIQAMIIEKQSSEETVSRCKEEIAGNNHGLVECREKIRENQSSIEEAREILAVKDQMMRAAHRSEPSFANTEIMIVSDMQRLINEAEYHVNETEAAIREFESTIVLLEEAKKQSVICATQASRLAREQKKWIDDAQQSLENMERFIEEAERISSSRWLMTRSRREFTYMKELSMCLEESLPRDIFRIIDQNDECPINGRNVYIVVELINHPSFGKVYITCAPENDNARFEIHTSSHGSIDKHEDVEISTPCMTEKSVIKWLRKCERDADMST